RDRRRRFQPRHHDHVLRLSFPGDPGSVVPARLPAAAQGGLMRRGAGAPLVAILCVAVPALSCAQENKDLDLIPQAIQDDSPRPPARTPRGRFYVEDALTLSSLREGLVVPFPPPSPPRWQNRTSLDAFNQWDLGEHLTATLSDRFNVLEQSGVDFPARQSFRNDFREGYMTW